MKIDILTLFPEMFSPLENSIVGKAREKGLLEINYHNFRENAEKARHVDDEPYDGGQGMLLRAQPIFDAFDAIEKKNPRVILLDPAGRTFDQRYAEELAQEEELNFICGHYEGYDERIKTLVADEISLGDYVLLDNPKTIERLGFLSQPLFLLWRGIIKKGIWWGTPMFHKDNPEYNRRQVGFYTLDELVPKDHLNVVFTLQSRAF